MTLVAHRPVAPRRSGRAPRACRARLDAAAALAAARSATRPSASRPATAPSSTSPARRRPRRSTALAELAGEPLDAASLYHLARRGGRAAPLPRRGRARLARARARARSSGRCAPPSRPARPGALLDRLFRQALARRQARAHRDGDRREPGVRVVGCRRARRSRSSATSTGRRVLLVGAGEIGELAARNLASRGAGSRTSRTARPTRPRELAHALRRAGARRSTEFAAVLGRRRRRRLVDERAGARARARGVDVPAARQGRPLFLIDIAVPRDLDPVLARARRLLPLRHRRPRGRRRRDASPAGAREAERAEQLAAEEAERFRAWRASLDVVPAIASLRARAEEIRSAELAKVAAVTDAERASSSR